MQRGAALLIFALGIVTGICSSVVVSHGTRPVEAAVASPGSRPPANGIEETIPIPVPIATNMCTGPKNDWPCINTVGQASSTVAPVKNYKPGRIYDALTGMPSIAGGIVTTSYGSSNAKYKGSGGTSLVLITLYEARNDKNGFGVGSRLMQTFAVQAGTTVVTCRFKEGEPCPYPSPGK